MPTKLKTLIFASLLLLISAVSLSAAALVPGVSVMSGNTILVPLSASDEPNTTVFLITSLAPDARSFIVRYTQAGQVYERVATRTGNTPQSLAVVVIRAPLAEMTEVSIRGVGEGTPDRF